MQDVEQMLLNEYHKIERVIEKRKRRLAALSKEVNSEENTLTRRPKFYSAEFVFEPGVLQPQTQTFAIDGGTVFRPITLASSFRITARLIQGEDDVFGVGQLTLPYGVSGNQGSFGGGAFRNENFDYLWRIRDTGSDREWQNEYQPSVFMMTGALSPLWLPIPGKLDGGSDVAVDIDPVFSRTAQSFIFDNVLEYRLTIQLGGTEEVYC